MAALTPQAFARRWGECTLSERSAYQQHFLDLCEVLDVFGEDGLRSYILEYIEGSDDLAEGLEEG